MDTATTARKTEIGSVISYTLRLPEALLLTA